MQIRVSKLSNKAKNFGAMSSKKKIKTYYGIPVLINVHSKTAKAKVEVLSNFFSAVFASTVMPQKNHMFILDDYLLSEFILDNYLDIIDEAMRNELQKLEAYRLAKGRWSPPLELKELSKKMQHYW